MTTAYRANLPADAEAERDAREDADAEWRRASVRANDQAELAAIEAADMAAQLAALVADESADLRTALAAMTERAKCAEQEVRQLRQELRAAKGALCRERGFGQGI